MIDRLFFIFLVLNATGLFAFVAPHMDVSIGQVSVVLAWINVFYLFVKARYSTAIVLRGGIGGWLFVLLLWPLLTLLYAPSFEVRQIGQQLYFFVLFFSAVTYTVANGLPAMNRVLCVSLLVTVIGVPLSMLAPQYFSTVAELAGAIRFENEGRPCGFLLQPNSLATAIVFLFIGWFAVWERKHTLIEVTAILGFLLLLLLTGSRSGVLVAAIVMAFALTFSWRRGFASGRLLLKTGAFIACLAGGIVGMKHYLSQMEYTDVRREDLVSRMETMLHFRLSDDSNLREDGSIQARVGAQEAYWSLVKEEPLLGHGLGSNAYYREGNSISKDAHSDALACAMEYGIFYPVCYGLLMLQLYWKRSRRDVERIFRTNSIMQFVFALIFLFVINGGSLHDRAFYVVLGMFFAAIYCPQYVFDYDETTGRICRALTRREITKRLPRARRLQSTSVPTIHGRNRPVREGVAGR